MLRPAHKIGAEGNLRTSVPLRGEPVHAYQQFEMLAFDDRELRARLLPFEPEQDRSRLDAIAVAREDLVNDAAGRMLDDLPPAFDFKPACSNDGPGDFGEVRPAAETADKEHESQKSDADMAPASPSGWRRLGGAAMRWCRVVGQVAFHHPGLPSAASFGVPKIWAWFLTRARRISSRGPKARAAPFSRARRRSHSAIPAGRCAVTITARRSSFAVRMAALSASEPSASRFEFGSSSTRTTGSP